MLFLPRIEARRELIELLYWKDYQLEDEARSYYRQSEELAHSHEWKIIDITEQFYRMRQSQMLDHVTRT